MGTLPASCAAVDRITPARFEELATRRTRPRLHRLLPPRPLQPPRAPPPLIAATSTQAGHMSIDLAATRPAPSSNGVWCHGSALQNGKSDYPSMGGYRGVRTCGPE